MSTMTKEQRELAEAASKAVRAVLQEHGLTGCFVGLNIKHAYSVNVGELADPLTMYVKVDGIDRMDMGLMDRIASGRMNAVEVLAALKRVHASLTQLQVIREQLVISLDNVIDLEQCLKHAARGLTPEVLG